MSDPRNPNYRGIKCKGCGEYLPTLLDDLCSYCTHERDKNEITRLRALLREERELNKKLTAANETMLLMGAKSQDEIERLKADPGLYATGDRSILEQNQEYKREIERLQKVSEGYWWFIQSDRKRIAELEHKQFHLLWMLETAGIDSSAAKDAECVLGDDCPHFTGERE